MFQRRPKRFSRRSNGRNHSSRMNGGKDNLRINLFPSDKHRNNNFRSSHNAEKMFAKYTLYILNDESSQIHLSDKDVKQKNLYVPYYYILSWMIKI